MIYVTLESRKGHFFVCVIRIIDPIFICAYDGGMQLEEILTPPKTIAIVGLSDKPERPSFQVARYLYSQGFTIIPVNPHISDFFGSQAYPSIADIPNEIVIDVVDIFRKSEDVPAIVSQVIDSGRTPVIWMQEGVISEEAQQRAQAHGLFVVMDQCMMKTHAKLQLSERSHV